MKARHIILTLVAAILIAVPGSALAQGGPGYGPGGGGGQGPHCGGHHGSFADGGGGGALQFLDHALPRLAERLELSDEQVAQIQTIVDEARPTIDGYVEQIRAGREAYRTANSDPLAFDETTFRAHAEAQHDLQIELMVVAAKTRAQVFEVLTADQRAQLEEMRSNRDKRSMRHSRGRRQ